VEKKQERRSTLIGNKTEDIEVQPILHITNLPIALVRFVVNPTVSSISQ